MNLEKTQERFLQQAVRIERLEEEMRRMVKEGICEQTLFDATTEEGDKQADHYFGDGVYARGLWIPKGTIVVGRLHLQARICVIAAGHCKWIDEFTNEAIEVQAPWVGEFKAGSKTAVAALEDTYWVAILGTNEKSSRVIADTLTLSSHAEYEKLLEGKL